ncbi:MAG: hypothetical protein WD993_06375 [Thermoleophilaceae bacterium]
MADDRAPIQSYARIFKPDRRIYAVEGYRLPVPGGVPLGWLGYAVAALVAVIALSGRSWTVAILAGLVVAGAGFVAGDRATAIVVGVATVGAAQTAGFALAAVDWPLRLLIVPAAVATLATQATPDGRPAHRYALSWLALQLRPSRRSLGRPLPAAGTRREHRTLLAVAADVHEWLLDRSRVTGPATVRFAAPLPVSERRTRRGRLVAHPPRRLARGEVTTVDRVELADGERLELRR